MATLAMATADLQDATFVTFNGVISNEQARTGTYSYKYSGGQSLILPFVAQSTFYFRIAIYQNNVILYLQFREGIIVHTQIQITAFVNPAIFKYTTPIGTAPFTIPYNTWYVLEGKIIIHDTAGRVTLRVNGVEIYDLNNVDTRNSGTGVVDNLYIVGSGGLIAYIDDIVIDSAVYPGLGGIEVLLPDADGANTAWTNGFAAVDDNPPNNDTDYIYADAATPDIKETFTFPDCNAATVTVPRVGIITKSRLDAVGVGTIKPMLNADIPAGTALSTSYQWVNRFYDTDPSDAGVWTKAKVNVIDAGVST